MIGVLTSRRIPRGLRRNRSAVPPHWFKLTHAGQGIGRAAAGSIVPVNRPVARTCRRSGDPNRARRGLYVVHFPGPVPGVVERVQAALAERASGVLDGGVAVTYGDGFYLPERARMRTVQWTAGDATLTTSEPGHLANGAFSLPQPLRVELGRSSWTGPTANEGVTVTFKQSIGRTDALRTGAYSKTLTFTLSTTNP